MFVVDPGAQALVELNLATGVRRTIASGLPIGAPPGVTPKPLRGIAHVGPLGPFAGITGDPDREIFISGDAEGCVISLRRR